MMFLGLHKLGNICTQNGSEQHQKHFLCPGHKICVGANGETFVSATMCPRLPGPLKTAR